ncbi:hypothetical protein D3C73_713950 [compost metagenome]
MRPRLLKLLDYLNLVSTDIRLVEEVDVLNASIVKDEIKDIIVVDSTGFVRDAVARPI